MPGVVRYQVEVGDEARDIGSLAYTDSTMQEITLANGSTNVALDFGGVTTADFLHLTSDRDISVYFASSGTEIPVKANKPLILSGTALTAIYVTNQSGSEAHLKWRIYGDSGASTTPAVSDLSTALANTSNDALGDAMIGYKASGTGATARTVHDRFTDFAISVKDYGATGDGTTDDTAAIQAALDAAKTNATPVYFPSGNYLVTDSLDGTGVNTANGCKEFWAILGDGRNASRIVGNLGDASAILDLTDSHGSTIRGIQIYGHASGSQLCGILQSQASGNRARSMRTENTLINGTYAAAGIINYNSDIPVYSGTQVYGPVGILFAEDVDCLGVGAIASKYQTLTSSTDTTMAFINNGSYIEGVGGGVSGFDAAIVMQEFPTVHITDSYVAQSGTATAGFKLIGETGAFHNYHAIHYINSGYENTSSNAMNFVYIDNPAGLKNSTFVGHANGKAPAGTETGQWFYINRGYIAGSTIHMTHNGYLSASGHIVQRDAAATGTIYNCTFHEAVTSGLLDGRDAAHFGSGNIIHLYAWHDDWLNVPDGNFFMVPKVTPATDGITGQINYTAERYNKVGPTTSFARAFVGHLAGDWAAAATTAAAGDENLLSYTLPGDIGYVNDARSRVILRLTSEGTFAANANAKTLKCKFGISGSETTVVYNDVTGSPNGVEYIMEVEFHRVNSTNYWRYRGKLFVGSVLQSVTLGDIDADPSANTIKLLITGDAALNDLTMNGYSIEVF